MTSTAICDLLAETETRSVAGAAGHCTLVILLPIDSSNDVCVNNECRVLEVAVKLKRSYEAMKGRWERRDQLTKQQ